MCPAVVSSRNRIAHFSPDFSTLLFQQHSRWDTHQPRWLSSRWCGFRGKPWSGNDDYNDDHQVRAFSRQFFTQKFWVKSESTPVFLSKILSLSQTNCVNLRHICFKNYQNSKMYPNITWCKRPITVNGKRRVNVFFREKLGWSAFLSFYYWIVSELISYRNGSSLASFAFVSSCFFFLFLVASSSFFPPVLSSTCLRFSFFWSWEFSFFFFWASFSSAAFFSGKNSFLCNNQFLHLLWD